MSPIALYVTLSARALNPEIHILARASDIDIEKKLRMAGADQVISPYYICGKRMASWAMKPATSDFLDTVMHNSSLDFSLQEITIPEGSTLAGKNLSDADIRKKSGAMVLAILKQDGTFNLQPAAESLIRAGDTFIVIGTPEQLSLLKEVAGSA